MLAAHLEWLDEVETRAVMSQGQAESSRDKVLFPDAGLTKADLADYYAAVAEACSRTCATAR